MRILSIQVGLPKDVTFHGKVVTTGIFKDPVKGPVQVRKLNLDGDGQADLSVHGGLDKAIYAYSLDAYPWWKKERPNDVFEYGAFGENLTTDALPEDKICIGDTFEVGGTVLQVAQPRFPCYKLGVKFNDTSILKAFIKSGRPGIYFRVLKEGSIDIQDTFRLISQEKVRLSVAELFSVTQGAPVTPAQAEEYATIATLPDSYRKRFRALADARS